MFGTVSDAMCFGQCEIGDRPGHHDDDDLTDCAEPQHHKADFDRADAGRTVAQRTVDPALVRSWV
uniref:hypothetical protein n=1 Tax=Mycolicibacterium sarraceniae TaxID=1534348 RepID=UPI0013D6C117|nr:hypothetical protein [Mycolicibacterium sarraceniae]